MADSEAAQFLEGYLMQWNALPWLGTAKWCMFDTGEVNAAQTRTIWVWPWPDGKVTFRWPFNDYLGVSDMWRLPKNGFYFLQSQWTEKPMIHIVGHWTWPAQEGQRRQVRVYSNCDRVELLLNGRSLGVHTPASNEQVWQDFRRLIDRQRTLRDWQDDYSQVPFAGASLRHPPFVWDEIPYESGSLVAIGHKGEDTVREEVRTAGLPTRIVLKSEKTTLAMNREDVSFLEADVVDSNGTIVPDAHPWIRFTVEGPGRLLGGATEIDAISGVAAINVQTAGQPGELVVTASAEGLEPGSVRIQATKE
jgi:beta-galactosidase